MLIYLIPIFLIGFFSLLVLTISSNQLVRKKISAQLSIIISLLLIAILAFRDSSVGIDVKGYLNFWSRAGIRDVSETTRFEFMFVKLTEFSHLISESPYFFLFIIAILSIAPLSFLIYKNSSDPILSWLVYICLGFYAFTFSGLRQAIAYGLTALSIHFIMRKKLLAFLLLVCLASTFHASAIIFLPAYWLFWYRIKPIGIAIYLALVPVIFLFRVEIFQWFTTEFYSNYTIEVSSSFRWMLISASFVSICWIRLASLKSQNLSVPKSENATGLIQLATIGVTLMLFASVGTNVMRMADYFYFAIVLAIPTMLQTFKPLTRLLLKIYFSGALIVIYLLQMSSSPYSIVPYISFLQSS